MDINTIAEAFSLPAIVSFVYIVIEALKMMIHSDRFKKLIPLICVIIGGAAGAALHLFTPGMIPADDILTAIMIGCASGWAATGADQTFKKLAKGDDMDGT